MGRLVWKIGGKLHLPGQEIGTSWCGVEGVWEEDYQDFPECRVCIEALEPV